MNTWTNITALAKSALTTAQQKIDEVLDIHEENVIDDAVVGSGFGVDFQQQNYSRGDLLDIDISAIESVGDSVDSTKHLGPSPDIDDISHVTSEASCNAAFNSDCGLNSTVSFIEQNFGDIAYRKLSFSTYVEKDYQTEGETETCDSEESSSATLVGSIAAGPSGNGKSTVSSFPDQRSVSNVIPLSFVSQEEEESAVQDADGISAARDCIHRMLKLLEESDDFGQPESRSKVQICGEQMVMASEHSTCSRTNSSKGSSPSHSKMAFEILPNCKGSESGSPCEEGETTTSSDIEIISYSLDDNNSDHSSKSSIAHACEINNHAIFSKVFEGRFGGFSEESFEGMSQENPRQLTKSPTLNNLHSDFDKDGLLVKQQLEKREKSLIEIVTQNSILVSENDELKRKLQETIQQLRNSSSSRVNDELRSTCNTLTDQNKEYKWKMEKLQNDLKCGMQQLRQLLSQKEEQVQQLLAEGEELSKKELKQSTLIKKLREKEKESIKTVENLEAKLKSAEEVKRALADKSNEVHTKDSTYHSLEV
ncbi:unnamed protein product [Soboliphyme baturini]|uniref:TATA element modulatory factor n=1 Tax=Soboliphyme baturini TaxID=241478 RepID=A0A183IJW9_9BILA|nr:unnamed protein product [Soboliphyme baturini]